MEVNPDLKAQQHQKMEVGTDAAAAAAAEEAKKAEKAAKRAAKMAAEDPAAAAAREAKKQAGIAAALAKKEALAKKQAEEKLAKAAKAAAKEGGAQAAGTDAATAEEEDKLVLANAVQGAVVTRFPPEASGFLHIGHAKAALVNSLLRTKYGGKMIFRFDDTNPEKERHDYELAIAADLESLGVKPDVGPTYSSDFFDTMLEKATWLIGEGKAYCDFTEKEEMRKARFDGYATPCRAHSVEENQRLWKEMQAGSAEGQKTCLRAAISIDAANKALRDPVLYRVNLNPHPRTGDKYKVYPTYDFCCPIVDSLEGVTHALRTNEYHDRNDQYYWLCDALGLRKPQVEDFSRLNLEYTLMSKRKLTQLVDNGTVDGWDDPRFPTVRGLLRRGLQVGALCDFVKVQGMSKSSNLMEWSKLWAFNSAILDPAVPRYTVVSAETTVKCTVTNSPGHMVAATKLRHKKNESLGSKEFFHSDVVALDAADVALLKDGDEVTLMDWCNAFIREITKDADGMPVGAKLELNPDGDVRKTKYKLTWVPENPAGEVKVDLYEFDHLLTKKKPEDGDEIVDILAPVTKFHMKASGEAAMTELKKGQCVQLERRGFYIVDSVADDKKSMSLFLIPDGRDKVGHLTAKAAWQKRQ